ncbi:CocE/NonD family hydrolase [Pararhizobium mangrovi]|uniref:CocE/NonD family hydrolase n=1 Tax=Pararhizobium mangrovi TaxID=2590452 RepID=A0A506TXV6_9HYPH|nr:CocE/NonD family hydrolase [Pararhizobium mangrovi]TPW26146.1 CocE/NonD family hydrolase [Pararhizobium mangrovi]
MAIVREFPRAVQELEHVEIPMPDGCRLAARIWLPEDAEDHPVPAVLEYIPYRKNDLTLKRDAGTAPYVAGHGYAYVRLDLRGAGDSEGIMLDEYTPQELQDGADAIAWLTEQPWCAGSIGMIGISWGGFNGLQVAALQPSALRAVITCCSTDDRYADDIHYMGGTMLVDQLSWASVMFGENTLPPDPRNVGDRWRDDWMQRLQENDLWLKTWTEHQTRDDFWKHGSVCENFDDVQVPVYAVSGWADGYCRSVFRLMENLKGPRKGLVGPWAHTYPHLGQPLPAINFLDEEIRWWDHWLKGEENGVMDEPRLRIFMQDHAEPKSFYERRQGRWIAEPSWPSPNVTPARFNLMQGGRLDRREAVGETAPMTINSPLSVGLAGGKWCSYAMPGDQPVDQRADDAGSLVFETAPLDEPFEMAGDAALDLVFESDRPDAIVAVRLSDVAPDGAATRVSYGLFNLTHRKSHEFPEKLEPGKRTTVTVPFKHVAQHFRRGHRIRLSISTNYFPLAWPSPEPVTLTVHPGECTLRLPERTPSPDDRALERFGEAQTAPPLDLTTVEPEKQSWHVVNDLGRGTTTVKVVDDSGTFHFPDSDLTVAKRGTETYGFTANDYRSVYGEVTWSFDFSRDDWWVRTKTWTRLTASAEAFHIEAKLEAWEGDEKVAERVWDEQIPRNHL